MLERPVGCYKLPAVHSCPNPVGEGRPVVYFLLCCLGGPAQFGLVLAVSSGETVEAAEVRKEGTDVETPLAELT